MAQPESVVAPKKQTNRWGNPAKQQVKVKMTKHLCVASLAGLLALTACKTTPQMTNRPEFLSTYSHLRQVDDLNWRYLDPVLLGQCKSFIVSPVKVLFTEYQGKPVTAEQRQKTADFVRDTVVKALEGRYPIVNQPGPDVAEIRVAMTEAYRTGGKLGLCWQMEILDNSNTQVAAVMRTLLSELYVPGWETKATARQMVDEASQRLRQVIDDSRAK